MPLAKLIVERVNYMPESLSSGVLYVSVAFRLAIHLCACGCGSKTVTPLGRGEWSLEETSPGPTLHPSIGNFQFPCRSHYWVRDGEIVWAN